MGRLAQPDKPLLGLGCRKECLHALLRESANGRGGKGGIDRKYARAALRPVIQPVDNRLCNLVGNILGTFRVHLCGLEWEDLRLESECAPTASIDPSLCRSDRDASRGLYGHCHGAATYREFPLRC